MPWWTCFNCANLKATQNNQDDVYILDFTHHSLHDVPPSVFIHERSLEELYLSSNRVHIYTLTFLNSDSIIANHNNRFFFLGMPLIDHRTSTEAVLLS